jgi:large subunit ribosomal protein L9
MEIILKQDVKHVGSKDDLVKVKNGLGSNYLLPKGFAILATESAKKQLDETKKQRAHKEEKIRVAAEGQAKWFEGKVIQVATKAGENGKIFGSVTPIQLAEAIKKMGMEIDRKSILMDDDHVKALGTYTAKIKLYKDVVVPLNFEVVSE